jgi:hypothetical protein
VRHPEVAPIYVVLDQDEAPARPKIALKPLNNLSLPAVWLKMKRIRQHGPI